jgi:hypothetical protein
MRCGIWETTFFRDSTRTTWLSGCWMFSYTWAVIASSATISATHESGLAGVKAQVSRALSWALLGVPMVEHRWSVFSVKARDAMPPSPAWIRASKLSTAIASWRKAFSWSRFFNWIAWVAARCLTRSCISKCLSSWYLCLTYNIDSGSHRSTKALVDACSSMLKSVEVRTNPASPYFWFSISFRDMP